MIGTRGDGKRFARDVSDYDARRKTVPGLRMFAIRG